MSEALTLARPYARAAFAIAQPANATVQWSQGLGLAARIAADPSVAALLGDPRLTRSDAVTLLAGDDDQALFGNFLELLADNRRLPLLPEIAGLFDELRAQAEHVVKATVTSAVELPAQELQTITAALKRRFGSEVEITTAIDAALLGGAVIDAGDVVIDGSLRGKLARLQAAMAG